MSDFQMGKKLNVPEVYHREINPNVVFIMQEIEVPRQANKD